MPHDNNNKPSDLVLLGDVNPDKADDASCKSTVDMIEKMMSPTTLDAMRASPGGMATMGYSALSGYYGNLIALGCVLPE